MGVILGLATGARIVGRGVYTVQRHLLVRSSVTINVRVSSYRQIVTRARRLINCLQNVAQWISWGPLMAPTNF